MITNNNYCCFLVVLVPVTFFGVILFYIALFVVILSFSSYATINSPVGVLETATGSATIITPIAISNGGNMNFGSIAVSATAG